MKKKDLNGKKYLKDQFEFFENKNRKKRIHIKGNLEGGFIQFLSKK